MEQIIRHAGYGRRRPIRIEHAQSPFLEAEALSNLTTDARVQPTFSVADVDDLLEALRDPAYFGRAFIDAGALCWPNGLGLSPAVLDALNQTAAQLQLAPLPQ